MRFTGLKASSGPAMAGDRLSKVVDEGEKIALPGRIKSLALPAILASMMSMPAVVNAAGRYPVKAEAVSTGDSSADASSFDVWTEINRINALQASPEVTAVTAVYDQNRAVRNAQSQCKYPFERRSISYRRDKTKIVVEVNAGARVSERNLLWEGRGIIPGTSGEVSYSGGLFVQCPNIVTVQRRAAIYETKVGKLPKSMQSMRRISRYAIMQYWPKEESPRTEVHNAQQVNFSNLPSHRRKDLWIFVREKVTPKYPGVGASFTTRQSFGYRIPPTSNKSFKTKNIADRVILK